MAEYNKYAALADTTEIEYITSNTINQSILQRLKDNDLEFTRLVYTTNHFTEQESNDHYYLPSGREDVGWRARILHWSKYKITRANILPNK